MPTTLERQYQFQLRKACLMKEAKEEKQHFAVSIMNIIEQLASLYGLKPKYSQCQCNVGKRDDLRDCSDKIKCPSIYNKNPKRIRVFLDDDDTLLHRPGYNEAIRRFQLGLDSDDFSFELPDKTACEHTRILLEYLFMNPIVHDVCIVSKNKDCEKIFADCNLTRYISKFLIQTDELTYDPSTSKVETKRDSKGQLVHNYISSVPIFDEHSNALETTCCLFVDDVQEHLERFKAIFKQDDLCHFLALNTNELI